MEQFELKCPECGLNEIIGDNLDTEEGWNNAVCTCGHKYSYAEYEQMSAEVSVEMLRNGLKGIWD
ncbi:hypothetical protein [Yersinia intermedia]|uniref:hypothetical protein n=1 Tax=Yersinia intermedia TaxID=631 RepID=UPI000B4084B2|nr:hypothetical protein [Yersinia intermedia]OVZ72925.1 hypothetical protein CBW55_22780 [Yersinia intermedia]